MYAMIYVLAGLAVISLRLVSALIVARIFRVQVEPYEYGPIEVVGGILLWPVELLLWAVGIISLLGAVIGERRDRAFVRRLEARRGEANGTELAGARRPKESRADTLIITVPAALKEPGGVVIEKEKPR